MVDLRSQHLRIKRFLASSKIAVKTQIWCSVATFVLIAIVKKELHLDASLYTYLQILSVSAFARKPRFYAPGRPLDPVPTCPIALTN